MGSTKIRLTGAENLLTNGVWFSFGKSNLLPLRNTVLSLNQMNFNKLLHLTLKSSQLFKVKIPDPA
jgi:hypothetical protein